MSVSVIEDKVKILWEVKTMASTGNGDRKIRLLAVYKLLLETSAEKPITITEIIRRTNREYNLNIQHITIYNDLDCIAIVDPRLQRQVRHGTGGTLCWIEKE